MKTVWYIIGAVVLLVLVFMVGRWTREEVIIEKVITVLFPNQEYVDKLDDVLAQIKTINTEWSIGKYEIPTDTGLFIVDTNTRFCDMPYGATTFDPSIYLYVDSTKIDKELIVITYGVGRNDSVSVEVTEDTIYIKEYIKVPKPKEKLLAPYFACAVSCNIQKEYMFGIESGLEIKNRVQTFILYDGEFRAGVRAVLK